MAEQDLLAIRRAMERMPRAGWPFAALAVLVALQTLARAASIPDWVAFPDLKVSTTALAIASAGMATIPAAVLWGAPEAWESDRLVFFGAVLWTTPGPAIALLRMVIPGASADGGWHETLSAAATAASVVGYVAPLAVVAGLASRRVTEATWPRRAVIAWAILCAMAVVRLLSLTLGQLDAESWLYPDESRRLAAYADSLYPLTLLSLGGLAWMALSGLRAGEAPRRFWLLLTGGSALLLGLSIQGVAIDAAASLDVALALGTGPIAALAVVARVVGPLLLVAAFMTGLPDVQVPGESDIENLRSGRKRARLVRKHVRPRREDRSPNAPPARSGRS